jgi:hypothetical protein
MERFDCLSIAVDCDIPLNPTARLLSSFAQPMVRIELD